VSGPIFHSCQKKKSKKLDEMENKPPNTSTRENIKVYGSKICERKNRGKWEMCRIVRRSKKKTRNEDRRK
jgi:hypothetical protein